MSVHSFDRLRRNLSLRSLLPGVNQPDGRRFRVNNVNCATISYVDAKCGPWLVGNKTIVSGKVLIAENRRIDDRHSVAMYLFGCQKRPIRHVQCAARRIMSILESD